MGIRHAQEKAVPGLGGRRRRKVGKEGGRKGGGTEGKSPEEITRALSAAPSAAAVPDAWLLVATSQPFPPHASTAARSSGGCRVPRLRPNGEHSGGTLLCSTERKPRPPPESRAQGSPILGAGAKGPRRPSGGSSHFSFFPEPLLVPSPEDAREVIARGKEAHEMPPEDPHRSEGPRPEQQTRPPPTDPGRNSVPLQEGALVAKPSPRQEGVRRQTDLTLVPEPQPPPAPAPHMPPPERGRSRRRRQSHRRDRDDHAGSRADAGARA